MSNGTNQQTNSRWRAEVAGRQYTWSDAQLSLCVHTSVQRFVHTSVQRFETSERASTGIKARLTIVGNRRWAYIRRAHGQRRGLCNTPSTSTVHHPNHNAQSEWELPSPDAVRCGQPIGIQGRSLSISGAAGTHAVSPSRERMGRHLRRRSMKALHRARTPPHEH